MKTKKHYNLTKKELSFLKSIEKRIVSDFNDKPLTKPIVLMVNPDTKDVIGIYTLKYFKHKVKESLISDYFEYHLRVVW